MSGDEQGHTHDIPDLQAYAAVANKARAVFEERNRARQSAFRKAGWKGNLVECRKKLDRLWAVWTSGSSPEEKDIDEALDLINAAIFVAMEMEDHNPNGEWPWP